MGQVLNSIERRIPTDVLSFQVSPKFGVLSGWSLVEVRRIYERFRKRKAGSGYHIPLSEFNVITRNSPLEGLTDSYQTFARGATRSVNMLEFLSALVLFAVTTWENKVLFAMRLFDFDNNRCLSRDEVTIMCASALNGFSSLTGAPRLQTSQTAMLSDLMFARADTNPDGLVTYDEMKMWVESVPDLKELLMRTQPLEGTHDPDMVFLYMNEIERVEKPNRRRAARKAAETSRSKGTFGGETLRGKLTPSPVNLPPIRPKKGVAHASSLSLLATPRPAFVVVRGQVINREQVITLKQVFDEIDRSKDGSWSFEEFRAALSKVPSIQKMAHSLFREYDSNSSGSITFDEILVKTYRGVSQKDLRVMLQWVRDRDAQLYMKLNLPTVTRKRVLSIKSAKQIQDLFEMYDTNKDGELSLAELKAGLGHMFSGKDIEAMLARYDTNKDDSISLYEFLRMMAPENSEFSHEVVKSYSHR